MPGRLSRPSQRSCIMSRNTNPYARVTSRPANESLERRRLLAAQIVIIEEQNTLYAQGTEGADTISVTRVGTDDVFVRVNDLSGTFDMDDFATIHLFGDAGNDTMTVFEGDYPVNVSVGGGLGNDTLFTASGGERLAGHGGDDVIIANGGDDTIHGDDGRSEA